MSWFTEMKTSSKIALACGAVAAAGAVVYVVYRSRKGKIAHPTRDPDDCDADLEEEEPPTEVPEHKVLVLGLDGAGKSSLLAALAGQPIPASIPVTEGFHVIHMNQENAKWNLWEVGGGQSCRVHWPKFFAKTNLIVYVVDSADDERLEQSATALLGVLGDAELAGVPLLLAFNKQDLPEATRAEKLSEIFRLTELLQTRKVQVAICQVPPPDDSGASDLAGIAQVKQLVISLCS